MNPDFRQFPKWVRWLAQDEDGQWWGYEHEPHLADISWYENEVGKSARIDISDKKMDWKASLYKIKQ